MLRLASWLLPVLALLSMRCTLARADSNHMYASALTMQVRAAQLSRRGVLEQRSERLPSQSSTVVAAEQTGGNACSSLHRDRRGRRAISAHDSRLIRCVCLCRCLCALPDALSLIAGDAPSDAD